MNTIFHQERKKMDIQKCESCKKVSQEKNGIYCSFCGKLYEKLPEIPIESPIGKPSPKRYMFGIPERNGPFCRKCGGGQFGTRRCKCSYFHLH